MRHAGTAFFLILATLLCAPAGADDLSVDPKAATVCRPPDVRDYLYCAGGQCDDLGPFAGEIFATDTAAQLKLLSLEPDQRRSAQVVTLSRSETFVVVWKLNARERLERRGQPQDVAVRNYAWDKKAGEQLLDVFEAATNFYTFDYASGLDVALASTNDPDIPVVLVTRVFGPCPSERRRSVR